MPTHHHQVTVDTVELGYCRKKAPTLEAKASKQFQTRFIVPEDQADQSCDTKRRCLGDCALQELLPHTTTPVFFIDVNTDLGCTAICGTRLELLEIKPSN